MKQWLKWMGDIPLFERPSSSIRTSFPYTERQEDDKRWQNMRRGGKHWGKCQHVARCPFVWVACAFLDVKKNSAGVWKLYQEREREKGWGVYRWNGSSVILFCFPLCVCVWERARVCERARACGRLHACLCVLWVWVNLFCIFRSHGSTSLYSCHPTSCDLCPIPTGHPHSASNVYSLVQWHGILTAR